MQTVQELINLISWDRRIVSIPSEIQAPVRDLVIIDPTLSQRNYAAFVRSRALQQSLESGVPSEEEIIDLARTVGAWSKYDDELLAGAEQEIERLTQERTSEQYHFRKLKLGRAIEEVKKQAESARDRYSEFSCKSAEYVSNLEYVYHLMRQIVRHMDGSPVWQSETAFLNDRNNYQEFFVFVADNILQEGCLETADIRRVARSGDWRIFWSLNRENLPGLFDRPISEFNLNQRSLVYWSKVYDIAFDSYEDKPAETIIEDDGRFDEWLHNHLSSQSKDRTSRSGKLHNPKDHQEQGVIIDGHYIEECTCGVGTKPPPGLGLKPRHADDCRYGVFVGYDEEDKVRIAQEVYGRNPGTIRAIVGKEQKRIDEAGLIDERALRGKNTRKVLGMASQVAPRKKR